MFEDDDEDGEGEDDEDTETEAPAGEATNLTAAEEAQTRSECIPPRTELGLTK